MVKRLTVQIYEKSDYQLFVLTYCATQDLAKSPRFKWAAFRFSLFSYSFVLILILLIKFRQLLYESNLSLGHFDTNARKGTIGIKVNASLIHSLLTTDPHIIFSVYSFEYLWAISNRLWKLQCIWCVRKCKLFMIVFLNLEIKIQSPNYFQDIDSHDEIK